MSRFQLLPTPDQQAALVEHSRHPRFMWNLAGEHQQFYQPRRRDHRETGADQWIFGAA
jgi:putative transposase